MAMPAISRRNKIASIAQTLQYGLYFHCIDISLAYKRSKNFVVQNLNKTKQNFKKKQSPHEKHHTQNINHTVQSVLSDSEDIILASVCEPCLI